MPGKLELRHVRDTPERLDRQAGLLGYLPVQCLGQQLPGFDDTGGQGPGGRAVVIVLLDEEHLVLAPDQGDGHQKVTRHRQVPHVFSSTIARSMSFTPGMTLSKAPAALNGTLLSGMVSRRIGAASRPHLRWASSAAM